MRIEKRVDDSCVEFNIFEEIQNYQEIVQIKSALHNQAGLSPQKEFRISFCDALIVPSSVIGTLLELVEIHNINLNVTVVKPELYESLKKLTLIDILHVKKS